MNLSLVSISAAILTALYSYLFNIYLFHQKGGSMEEGAGSAPLHFHSAQESVWHIVGAQ